MFGITTSPKIKSLHEQLKSWTPKETYVYVSDEVAGMIVNEIEENRFVSADFYYDLENSPLYGKLRQAVVANNLKMGDTWFEEAELRVSGAAVELFDATRFSGISSEELFKIMGPPDERELEQEKEEGSDVYIYYGESPLEWIMIFGAENERIDSLSFFIVGEDIPFVSRGDIFEMFGITVSSDVKMLYKKHAVYLPEATYVHVSEEVGGVKINGLENNSFSSIDFFYDLENSLLLDDIRKAEAAGDVFAVIKQGMEP